MEIAGTEIINKEVINKRHVTRPFIGLDHFGARRGSSGEGSGVGCGFCSVFDFADEDFDPTVVARAGVVACASGLSTPRPGRWLSGRRWRGRQSDRGRASRRSSSCARTPGYDRHFAITESLGMPESSVRIASSAILTITADAARLAFLKVEGFRSPRGG